jgi:hypothetical protein
MEGANVHDGVHGAKNLRFRARISLKPSKNLFLFKYDITDAMMLMKEILPLLRRPRR